MTLLESEYHPTFVSQNYQFTQINMPVLHNLITITQVCTMAPYRFIGKYQSGYSKGYKLSHCYFKPQNVNQPLCWHHLKGTTTVSNRCGTAVEKGVKLCGKVKIRFDWYLFSCLPGCNLHFIKRPLPPGSLSVVAGFIDRNESPLREGVEHVS